MLNYLRVDHEDYEIDQSLQTTPKRSRVRYKSMDPSSGLLAYESGSNPLGITSSICSSRSLCSVIPYDQSLDKVIRCMPNPHANDIFEVGTNSGCLQTDPIVWGPEFN